MHDKRGFVAGGLGVTGCRKVLEGFADQSANNLDTRRKTIAPPNRAGFVLVAVLTLLGCSSPAPPSQGVSPPDPGREVAALMIEAHGGLEKWRSAPTVSFEVTNHPSGTVSRETVEQGARRAYHDFPGTDTRLAWDDTKAWSENWERRQSPRFAALLNYYFMNLPWLTADPGVILGEPGTGTLLDDPAEYITVQMSFEPGVGDTPDDTYLLYIDPNSYLLHATEFTVIYGRAEASEPRILVYEQFTTVDGLMVPIQAGSYRKDGSSSGFREISNWSFREPFDESRMVMPLGAVLDTSSPVPPPEASP